MMCTLSWLQCIILYGLLKLLAIKLICKFQLCKTSLVSHKSHTGQRKIFLCALCGWKFHTYKFFPSYRREYYVTTQHLHVVIKAQISHDRTLTGKFQDQNFVSRGFSHVFIQNKVQCMKTSKASIKIIFIHNICGCVCVLVSSVP